MTDSQFGKNPPFVYNLVQADETAKEGLEIKHEPDHDNPEVRLPLP
jgi:hypothetical protein